MNILVLNGPNLNLLGEREPTVYGTTTLADIERQMERTAEEFGGMQLRFLQSNHEGVLIDALHAERKWMDGVVMNPGAFTHYSYALRDAIASVAKPMIEVHLSDLTKREEFRQVTVFAGLPNVTRIMGRGAKGYLDALAALKMMLEGTTTDA